MPSTTASHERPREEWIEIPVPALVTEDSFARAQELLHQNKIRSRRRTIAPSVVQGLVTCAKCGYALSRTSTQTSARKIHYYKCIGSDSWRKLGGPVCDNGRFVRQELLDQIVWAEVIRLHPDLLEISGVARSCKGSREPSPKIEPRLVGDPSHLVFLCSDDGSAKIFREVRSREMDIRTPLFRRDSDVVTEEWIKISQNRVRTGVALSLRQNLSRSRRIFVRINVVFHDLQDGMI